MSKIYKFPDQDRVSDEASLWLAQLDRGLSAQESQELQRWMVRDRRHRETLFQMAELWDKMDSLSRLSDLFPPATLKPQPRFAFAHAAGLALVLAGLILGWLLLQPQGFFLREEVLAGVYETAIGESSLVELPDKSEVLLNTGTLMHMRYSDAQRHIVLERGEAYFTVAKDKDRPFVVHAGGRTIQAIGTAFNVRLREDKRVALLVTEGRVAVSESSDRPDRYARPESTETAAILQSRNATTWPQREAVTPDTQEIQIETIALEQMAIDLSWKKGNIVFNGETLEKAIHEISRYTTVKFEIVDEQIKQLRVAGMFKSGDIDGLLMTLHENFDIASRQVEEGHILLGINREENEAPITPRM